RFPLADVQRVPGASHADVENPDHRVPFGAVPQVGCVPGWTEIRKEKDDIRLAALYRVDRSDDHARRFLQRARSAGERDGDRELHAPMEFWGDASAPPVK